MMDFIGALAAFIIGCGISAFNWSMTYKKLKGHAETKGIIGVMTLRQLLNIALLVGIYLLRDALPFSLLWMLVGAALGLTLPSAYFVTKINKKLLSDDQARKDGEE